MKFPLPQRFVSRLLLVISGTVLVSAMLMAWVIQGMFEKNLLQRFDARSKANTLIVSGLLERTIVDLDHSISFVIHDRGFRDSVFYADVTADAQRLLDYLKNSNARLGVSVTEVLGHRSAVLASSNTAFSASKSWEEINIVRQASEGLKPAPRILRRENRFFIFYSSRFELDRDDVAPFVLNSWKALDNGWASSMSLLIQMDVLLFADGKIAASSSPYMAIGSAWENLPVDGGDGMVEHRGATRHYRMYASTLSTLGHESSGIISAGTDMTGIRRVILNASQFLMFQVGMMIITMVAFLSWIISQITRSLSKLVSVTQVIAREGPEKFENVKISTADSQEIITLSNSLNQMASALKDRLFKLSEANRKLEEVSSDQQTILANITAASPFAVMMVNQKDKIIVWNEAAQSFFGWTADEAVNHKEFSDVFDKESVSKALRLEAGLSSQKVVQGEILGLTKSGVSFPTEMTLSEVKSQQGNNLGRVVIFRDLRDMRKLEHVVLQSEKMAAIGQLAGGLAHDLNNGLTPVIGYIDVLLADDSMTESQKAMLAEGKQSAYRCKEVVDRLLSVSRPSGAGKGTVDLRRLLMEYEKLLRAVIPSTISVKTICVDGLLPIYGNEAEILSALTNMAINARDAMDGLSGGKFTVEANNINLEKLEKLGHPEGAYVVLTISDTGKGIPQSLLQKIFEPFFTTKTKDKGTGLGLSMVFNTVKGHGGWIDVSSQERQGTVFRIYLPAYRGNSEQKPAATTVPVPGRSQNLTHLEGKTVLFADDEDTIRSLGSAFLKRLGHDVLLAQDGEEALKIYSEQKTKIALVIMDMTMPKLTGLDLIQGILKINPQAKIIASSGYTSEGNENDVLQAGAAGYLAKPYVLTTFSEMIHRILNQ